MSHPNILVNTDLCIGLKKLNLNNIGICDNLDVYETISKITSRNNIEEVVIDSNTIKRYPAILELFNNIKIFEIVMCENYCSDLLQRIFDSINAQVTLDKLVIYDLFNDYDANYYYMCCDYIRLISCCSTIKILSTKSTYLNFFQLCPMLENVEIKIWHVTLEKTTVQPPTTFVYPIIDHIVEIHFNIVSFMLCDRDNVLYCLRNCLTSNSMILNVTVNNSNIIRWLSSGTLSYLIDLIKRNTNYQSNKLYVTTKAIMPSQV